MFWTIYTDYAVLVGEELYHVAPRFDPDCEWLLLAVDKVNRIRYE